MVALNEFKLDSPIFLAYALSVSILALKMTLMTVLTIIERLRKKAVANSKDEYQKRLLITIDEKVERVRRAHQNDLENIPLFIFVGFLYMLTDPSPAVAIIMFYLVAICRLVHTFVYAIVVIPQPARGISFGIPIICTFHMAVQTAIYFF